MSSYLSSPSAQPGSYENCPPFLEKYLNYLSVFNGRQPKTVTEYFVTLRSFCQFIHFKSLWESPPTAEDGLKNTDVSHMPVSEIAAVQQRDVADYLYFMEHTLGNTHATLRKKSITIRKFYEYLQSVHEDLGIPQPVENPVQEIIPPARKEQVLKILTPQQVEQLLSGISGENTKRDKAIVMLMVTAGLSLADVANLDRGDFLSDERLRIKARGRTPARTVFLTPACAASIRSYLPEGIRDDAPLICSSRGSYIRLTTKMIRQRVLIAAKKAGLSQLDVTPQVLRDTAAAAMLRSADAKDRNAIFAYFGYKGIPSKFNGIDSAETVKQALSRSPLSDIGKR